MKKGFSTLNFLVGILISFMILTLINSSVKLVLKRHTEFYNDDILASLQLYQILNLSQDVVITDSGLEFLYLNEERNIKLTNNKVIMTPGTLIYYVDVQRIKFEIIDEYIYLVITRNNKDLKYLIGEYHE